MKRIGHTAFALWLLLFAVALTGCDGNGGAAGRTSVWIDVPTSGAEFEPGPITVQFHAASGSGIIRAELSVNGSLVRTDDSPSTTTPVVFMAQSWTLTDPGEYALQVRVVAGNSSEATDVVTVTVLGSAPPPTAEPPGPSPETPADTPEPPTPEPPTSVPSPTTAPTPVPEIAFWAEATTVAAGSCTTVHWETEHVQAVFFDGQPVAGVGTHQTCPCVAESHVLDVTLPTSETGSYTVTIGVTGSCASPTPTPDATAPPAPVLTTPADGYVGMCSPTTLELGWQSVTDPSGIASYEVAVEVNFSGYWQPYWSRRVTGTSAQLSAADGYPLPCASYRWRARAQDGVGNIGPWSAWSGFSFTVY